LVKLKIKGEKWKTTTYFVDSLSLRYNRRDKTRCPFERRRPVVAQKELGGKVGAVELNDYIKKNFLNWHLRFI
jgi:hypothetical protein